MSSFYGGKQGRTYNIVHTYSSLAEMLQKFGQGGAYNIVNYGEYVLISTDTRSNPQNGLLYRRGFNYSEPSPVRSSIDNNLIIKTPIYDDYKEGIEGNNQTKYQAYISDLTNYIRNPGYGAIYVGNISGPEGAVPILKAESWDVFEDHEQDNIHSIDFTSNLDIRTLGREVKEQDGNTNITYADNIKVGLANTQDDYGNVGQAHVSFDIPITVFDTVIDSDAYHEPSVVRLLPEEEENSQGKNPEDHPFYYRWKFTIPRGKKGQSLDEIQVESGKDFKYIKVENPDFNPQNNYYKKNENDQFVLIDRQTDELDLNNCYEIDENNIDVIDDDKYFTYSKIDYDDNENGVKIEHLGQWPYRVIKEIKPVINEDRYIIEGNQEVSVSIGDLILLEHNDNSDIYAICISPGTYNSNNNIFNDFTVGQIKKDENDSSSPVWRIIQLNINEPLHALNIDYEAGANDYIDIKSLDFLFVDETGKLFAKYIEGENVQFHQICTIDSIKGITVESGKITVHYVSNKEDDIFPLKTIKEISLTDDITKSQDIIAKYNIYDSNEQEIQTQSEVIGNLNTIVDFRLKGNNLIALYSDPTVRDYIKVHYPHYDLNEQWINPITENTINGPLTWRNFGPVGASYHVLTAVNGFDRLIFGSSASDSIDEGLSDGYEGWVVKVNYQEDGEDKVALYAFDYQAYWAYENKSESQRTNEDIPYSVPGNSNNKMFWFEIASFEQELAANPKYSLLVSEENTQTHKPKLNDQELRENGLWFVVSNGHD